MEESPESFASATEYVAESVMSTTMSDTSLPSRQVQAKEASQSRPGQTPGVPPSSIPQSSTIRSSISSAPQSDPRVASTPQTSRSATIQQARRPEPKEFQIPVHLAAGAPFCYLDTNPNRIVVCRDSYCNNIRRGINLGHMNKN